MRSPDEVAQPHRNVETVMRLEREVRRRRSTAHRLALGVTAAAGSTPFLILHGLWFAAWIVVNTGHVPGITAFDPFPFGLLALTVALETIFLTLLIIMSQNHIMKEADKRAHLELQVNLLAEQESTLTLKMLRKICQRLGVEGGDGGEVRALESATDIGQLASALERKLPS